MANNKFNVHEPSATITASNITASSGVTIVSALGRKNNETVNIRAVFQKSLVLNQWNDLATLPSGYRPKDHGLNFPGLNSTKDLAIDTKIGGDGKIQVYPVAATADASTTNIAINATFII